jgi:hypothetical protein
MGINAVVEVEDIKVDGLRDGMTSISDLIG